MDVTSDRRVWYLAAGLALTAVVAAVAVGWLVWIASDPEYWFPGAYAEQGDKGATRRPGTARPARTARPRRTCRP
jgi:hypothetical protein